jgi:hypothetical protein
MPDKLLRLQGPEAVVDLNGKAILGNIELVQHQPLDLGAVAPGTYKLPQPRRRAVQLVDSIRPELNEHEVVAERHGDRIGMRVKAR